MQELTKAQEKRMCRIMDEEFTPYQVEHALSYGNLAENGVHVTWRYEIGDKMYHQRYDLKTKEITIKEVSK